MDKEQMKSEITKLIEKYNREKGKRYNEEATKNDFILPLFKILGWNTEDSNEVSKEENISGKRVDYGFRIDGIPKFFLEAKGLDEDLEGSRLVKGRQVTYAEQAINYAYYKGCNWAILTNFKGIIVYDAWAKANSQSSFRFAIWVDSLLSDFESVYLLSKESFEQGLLDKKYSTKSRKRPITEQLLLDFTNFRAILSKDVYALNKSKNLTEEELDEAIQRLFDRLIFIRNCEDRELEPYELLSALRQWKESSKGTLISKLRELFVQYNEDYDSKIFGEHKGDKHLCDQIDISDNVLSRILDGLYTTEDDSIQYDFSLIDADVLGNIYEQYLGHILKKTEKRTKLTESKAKRKEEGIYYTPSYIVDYIVRNTVGELIKSKKTDVSKIKVLDPACGSGSFLIKTFDVLNEYYSKERKNIARTMH
ncbi:MAG: N-6 DNA methylase [Candidatus Marsarchaeota archaeon]|nr:N-6 DNA methylase [Candidatus Marsarchaeota archaeon]